MRLEIPLLEMKDAKSPLVALAVLWRCVNTIIPSGTNGGRPNSGQKVLNIYPQKRLQKSLGFLSGPLIV